ncbi:CubicO group peptidase, beta-lactamase class C family [Aquiflexum balticum DSM 16537]|uniref:CubicO group peptidase, beta-lactamase class C family n=1 Tax=Aquiflexum balticum DSM 16537 TaxID=758820 RepID=A0A1W2H4G0_9BACT|nr:serine hydrolase domain-containing protein [Aquiflexum balticum]SMD43815.1 CubicO group peptidase, beta-lactamase class C family [Aquiflexum balticum DSM 16537]
MNSNVKSFFFQILCIALVLSCQNKTEKKIDEIFAQWNSDQTPGAAVAVVKNEKIVFKKGYGMSNLEYGIPITPSSIFHIASVSKQFTVFSILLLENEGKLSLEDDVRKYIPEVPDFGKTITLRHLANHTSGMRDQWNLLALAGWRLDDVITKEHVLKLVSNQKELNFDPGEEFAYCNTGFTLLAEVVARVSGMSFTEFTDSEIFKPLGMGNTFFYDDHEKIVPNRAYSYSKIDSLSYKKSVLSYANVGATSLFTTVEDLGLWAMNFQNPKVGNKEIIEKMNLPTVLNNGETIDGALGQFVDNYKGVQEISHGGADAGYRSFFARYPEQDLAVIVFSNDGSFNSGGLARQVADVFLEGIVENEDLKTTDPENIEGEMDIDLNTLLNYVGDYELEPGFILSIRESDGILSVQPTGEPLFQLKAISEKEFKVGDLEFIIEFRTGQQGIAESLILHDGDDVREAKKSEPFDFSTVNLSDFEGNFYSEELSTRYTFIVEGDTLVAKHSRHPDIHFNPTKKDFFTGNSWFFGQAEFIRNDNGTVTGLKASSGRVRNVWFEKVE